VQWLSLLAKPVLELIEAWLGPPTHEQVKEALIRFENQITTHGSQEVLRAPLRLISDLLDRFLGPRIRSWQSFRRYAKYNIVFLVVSLLVIGLLTKTVLAINPMPWDVYRLSLVGLKVALKQAPNNAALQNNPAKDQIVAFERSAVRLLSHSWLEITYSVLFFALIIALDLFLGYLVLALTRKVLRDMAVIEPLTMIYVLLGYADVIAALITIFITVMGVYLFPAGWLAIPLTMTFSMFSIWLGLATVFIVALLSWIFVPGFIKAIAVLIFSPAILFFLLLIGILILWPLKSWIHTIVLAFCRRSIEHEKGPLFLFFRVLLVMVVLITLLTLWA
jgi:hypothetical protein